MMTNTKLSTRALETRNEQILAAARYQGVTAAIDVECGAPRNGYLHAVEERWLALAAKSGWSMEEALRGFDALVEAYYERLGEGQ